MSENDNPRTCPPPDNTDGESSSSSASSESTISNTAESIVERTMPTYWETQPVVQPVKFDVFSHQIPVEGASLEDGPIIPPVPLEEIDTVAGDLPQGLEWSTVDIEIPDQLGELYQFLFDHYVEDHDGDFRLNYSPQALKWALASPGYHKEWHLAIRNKDSHSLAGFISGIPVRITVRGRTIPMCEINFLCVHRDHRSRRLTPALFTEITRLYRLKGISQAIFSGARSIFQPVSSAQYFHRSLNVPKLLDAEFLFPPKRQTVDELIEHYRIENTSPVLAAHGLREIEEQDVPEVHELWMRYNRRFQIYPELTKEEVHHFLLSAGGTGEPKDGHRDGQAVWTFVIEHAKNQKITDFVSFYSVPAVMLGESKYDRIDTAYLYYYATDVAFEDDDAYPAKLRSRLNDLIGDALIIANQAHFDVFNALDLMDNSLFLNDLKFSPGSGTLHYFLYNYRVAAIGNNPLLRPGEAKPEIGQPENGLGVVLT